MSVGRSGKAGSTATTSYAPGTSTNSTAAAVRAVRLQLDGDRDAVRGATVAAALKKALEEARA